MEWEWNGNGDRSKLLNFCITAILNVTFPHFITKEREEKAEVQNQSDEIEAGKLACCTVRNRAYKQRKTTRGFIALHRTFVTRGLVALKEL